MSIDTQFDSPIEFRRELFHLQGKFMSDDYFSLSLISQDFTERWFGAFTSDWVEDVTQRTGAFKRLPTFWRMLCNAAQRLSRTVSIEILIPADVLESLGSKMADDRVYVILTQVSEFERIKYPLPLEKRPFENEELISRIRFLYRENERLKELMEMTGKDESVETLEKQASALTARIEEVRSTKDREIANLQGRLTTLQSSPPISPGLRRRKSVISSTGSPFSKRSARNSK
jgi:coiled-coil domain-containing protein 61